MRRPLPRSARPAKAEPLPVEMTGIDLERLTPRGREVFWRNVSRHARYLYISACNRNTVTTHEPEMPVSAVDVEAAESELLASAVAKRPHFGAGFVLDALQIIGAATCGALATKPLAGGAEILPLAVAIALTVATFLVRESLDPRAQ